jgi:hypothetical protein
VDAVLRGGIAPSLIETGDLAQEGLGKRFLVIIIDQGDDRLGRGHGLFGICPLERLARSFQVPGIHVVPGLEIFDVLGEPLGGRDAHLAVSQIQGIILDVLG